MGRTWNREYLVRRCRIDCICRHEPPAHHRRRWFCGVEDAGQGQGHLRRRGRGEGASRGDGRRFVDAGGRQRGDGHRSRVRRRVPVLDVPRVRRHVDELEAPCQDDRRGGLSGARGVQSC